MKGAGGDPLSDVLLAEEPEDDGCDYAVGGTGEEGAVGGEDAGVEGGVGEVDVAEGEGVEG